MQYSLEWLEQKYNDGNNDPDNEEVSRISIIYSIN